MRITVTSDDGKQSASFEVPIDGTPKQLAETFALCCGNGFSRELINSITVTDAPAEPDDGFKFKLGQRVKQACGAIRVVASRFKSASGQSVYQLESQGPTGVLNWYDHELEPAE